MSKKKEAMDKNKGLQSEPRWLQDIVSNEKNCYVPNAWKFGEYAPAASDCGGHASGLDNIWPCDVQLQTSKPNREMAILENSEI